MRLCRTTGAKALFCLTALIILAGVNENIPGAPPADNPQLGTEGGREGETEGPTAEEKQNKNKKLKIEDRN